MKARLYILSVLTLLCMTAALAQSSSRRRMTPVETPATVTQNINEARNDSARILQARIARSTHFQDEEGRLIYVDTVTGEQWMDSAALMPVVKMKYPLLESASFGIDIWDPLMRAFGQDYGLAGVYAEISLHNRYIPVFEAGLGQAKHSPSGSNFNYSSPTRPYFRIGLNYNFLYNSDPNYRLYAGVRYGFSSFSYKISDVTLDAPYWDETTIFNIPSQSSTVGWFEFVFGLRVHLWGPISAGWSVKYHTILHESKNMYGQPWYIPGYGTRSGAVTGSLSVSYSFSLDKLNKRKAAEVIDSETSTAASEDTTAE